MPGEVTPTNPPDDSNTGSEGSVDDGTSSAPEADVLLIRECPPWSTTANQDVLDELGASYHIIGSTEIPGRDFSEYSVIVLASTQPMAVYQALSGRAQDIESFVVDGGTFVAHISKNGWNCGSSGNYQFLPDGVVITHRYADGASITDPSHPIMDEVSEADIDNWQSSLVHLSGLPGDASIFIRDDANNPTSAEYSVGNGLVIATGQVVEWPWVSIPQYGVQTKQFLRNELEYALNHNRVEASLMTLQFIPGTEENVSRGGHPLNSALMDVFPDNFLLPVEEPSGNMIDVPIDPVLDSWIGADMIESLPLDLDDALEQKHNKYVDDVPDESFNQYRFHNGIDISFEKTDDGGVDKQSIEIQFREPGDDPIDPKISTGDLSPSMTVFHDHELNGIPIEEWYGPLATSSNRQPRYYVYDDDFTFEGVEGVRVLSVTGGWAGYVKDLSKRVGDDPVALFSEINDWGVPDWIAKLAWAQAPFGLQFIADYLAVVPNTYSFIELIALADDRRYARVWDASVYPSLATYIDGERVDQQQMPYDPRELINPHMFAFHAFASAGITPYTSPLNFYSRLLDNEGLRESIADAGIIGIEPFDFDASEFLPPVPRVTAGLENEGGSEIEDPDAPFPATISSWWTSGTYGIIDPVY